MAKTLNAAAEDKKTVVAEVKRAGEAIMIPDNVSLTEAIKVLTEKQREEEQAVVLAERFDCFIWEGCYALAKALDKRFGWFKQMKTPSFWGDQPPALYTVKSGVDETIQVPWGRFLIPGIPAGDGFMATGYHLASNGLVCFQLTAEIKRKHSKQFNTLCEEIKHQLQAGSLYKGKAVTIKFRDEDGEKVKFPEPNFPAIARMTRESVVFSRHIERDLEANLFTPLTKTAQVRSKKIPLKRGILLAGPYGTGKTLVATLSANFAVDNGWTFLFCKSAADFTDCVTFAKQYQPAVVFCEDIDRVTDGNRDEKMDAILNTIDGVDSKSSEILLVLTTNEVENIHPGMLRPGRLDAVIIAERPDAEAVQRLIYQYGGEYIQANEKLDDVGRILAGHTPAVIREVVERSKLTALVLEENGQGKLSAQDLIYAAKTMNKQLELLNRKPKKDPDPMEVFGKTVAVHLLKGAKSALKQAPELPESLEAETETELVSN